MGTLKERIVTLFTYKHTKGRYPAEVLQGNLQPFRMERFPSLLPPLGGLIPFGGGHGRSYFLLRL